MTSCEDTNSELLNVTLAGKPCLQRKKLSLVTGQRIDTIEHLM